MFLNFAKIFLFFLIIFSFQLKAICQEKKDSLRIVHEVKKLNKKNKKNAKLSYMIYCQQKNSELYNIGFRFIQTNNIINPIAWYKFYEALKNGDLKNEK